MKRKPEADATPVPPKQKRGQGQHDGPRGSPAHKPTAKIRKKVDMLASVGMTHEEICLIVDIGRNTLNKYYAHELRVGGLKADADVLMNLKRMATGNGPEAGRTAIFWAKVRRRWHEVQRVIHGYDPETITAFVKGVVGLLRRELPDKCPGCNTVLNLPDKIAGHLYQMSQEMAARLPPSEVMMRPVPELASDGLGPAPDPGA